MELHALLQTFDEDSDSSDPGMDEPKRCKSIKFQCVASVVKISYLGKENESDEGRSEVMCRLPNH